MSNVFFSYSTELFKYEVGFRALNTNTVGMYDCHVWVAQYDELEEATMYEAEDFYVSVSDVENMMFVEEFVHARCKERLYRLLRNLSERFLLIADGVIHTTEFKKEPQ